MDLLNTTNITFSSPPEFAWNVWSVSNLVVGSLMTMITLGGQITVFIVVGHDARLRDAGNLYISSLALADLLLSVFSLPVWTAINTLGYWPLPQSVCDIWNVLDVILSEVSAETIGYIALDRFLCLRYPLRYPAWRSMTISWMSLGAVWALTAIYSGTLVFVTQLTLGGDRDPYDCVLYLISDFYLVLLLLVPCIWVPMFGTIGIYINIYKMAAKVAAVEKRQKAVRTVAASEGQASQPVGMKEDDLKALKSISLLLVTYMICWIPLNVVFIIASLNPQYLSLSFFTIVYWLGYLNSMLNPLCYALGNPNFKQTLRKLVSRK